MTGTIPSEARQTAEYYLGRVDRVLPHTIEGLYLVGSIGLGDYVPGQSDVDFVAVTRDSLSTRDLDLLKGVHDELQTAHSRPWFCGIYVTWEGLNHDPEAQHAPFYLEGTFGAGGGFEANPVVWFTLKHHAHALRGPARPDVWHDPEVLRRWNLDNLNSYWQNLVDEGRRVPVEEAHPLTDYMLFWCVSGPVRLHFTVNTEEVTSKSGACRYALQRFPEHWHPLIREAIAARHGLSLLPPRPARRGETLDFMAHVIADANALSPK
jgi:hypothetical protein